MMDIKIRSKLWIVVDEKPVFGRGRKFLLEAIDKHGSIGQAAKSINISYRKAWGYIRTVEQRLGFTLIDRRIGGRNGGGATLTENARKFLTKYEALEKGVREIVDDRFSNIFRAIDL